MRQSKSKVIISKVNVESTKIETLLDEYLPQIKTGDIDSIFEFDFPIENQILLNGGISQETIDFVRFYNRLKMKLKLKPIHILLKDSIDSSVKYYLSSHSIIKVFFTIDDIILRDLEMCSTVLYKQHLLGIQKHLIPALKNKLDVMGVLNSYPELEV